MTLSISQETASKLQLAESLGSLVSWEYWPKTNRIIFSNTMYDLGPSDTLSYDVSELISQIVQPDQQETISSIVQAVMTSGVIEKTDVRLQLPFASDRVGRIQGELCKTENGDTVIVGVFQDITEWRKAESKVQEKLTFFNTLLDTVSCPIYFLNTDLQFELCSNSFLDFFGCSREFLLGHKTSDLPAEHQSGLCATMDSDLLKSRKSHQCRTHVTLNDDSLHTLILSKSPVVDTFGNTLGIVGVLEDITDQVHISDSLQRIERMKDLVLEINNDLHTKSSLKELYDFILEKTLVFMDHADSGCILTLDDNNNFTIAASKGYLPTEAKTISFPMKESFYWVTTKGELNDAMIINDLSSYIAHSNGKALMRSESGEEIISTISTPITLNGRLFGLLNIDSIHNDIFKEDDQYLMDYLRDQLVNFISKFRLYESIVYLYDHDPQTGLYNRRYFDQAFAMAVEKGQRYGEDFLIASFDIDGLKSVNDLYGHLAGDELIHQFTKTLRLKLRNTDILARTGGDEFVAILFHADVEEMMVKFNGLKNYFKENPILFRRHTFVCSFSFGIAGFPADGISSNLLMNTADSRMYAQRAGGEGL